MTIGLQSRVKFISLFSKSLFWYLYYVYFMSSCLTTDTTYLKECGSKVEVNT